MYRIEKVAMTGGSGPVGLALINKLLDEGVEVLLFQRENSFKERFLPEHKSLNVVHCSLEEIKKYKTKRKDYDVFFHLGWANTSREKRNDMKSQLENVAYTCDAVEMAYQLGCHTFIGAGSQAEYGRHDEILTETTTCHPESAYGIMKLCACSASAALCEEKGIRHIWPRILSAYGKNDNLNSVLISTILKSMDGEVLNFSKGEQIWDFVYLDDVAEAFWRIALQGKHNARYPIGSGNSKSLRAYLEILCRELNVYEEARFGVIPYSPKQIMHLEADISSLTADTGWVPRTTFEDGIREVIRFYKQWRIINEQVYMDFRNGVGE